MAQLLKDTAQELCGFEVQPDLMLFDFEKGAHDAAAKVLKCSTRGCKFYFRQSLIRKIHKASLLWQIYCTPSQKDEHDRFVRNEGRYWLVSFLGLCQLPPEMVEEVFYLLFDNIPEGADFLTFCDYFLETYVDDSQAM